MTKNRVLKWSIETKFAWIFLLVSLTQYNKFLVILIFCYIDKSCHTERSEVFIKLKCILKFYGFFATLKMTKFL